jgi:hypothetical protein
MIRTLDLRRRIRGLRETGACDRHSGEALRIQAMSSGRSYPFFALSLISALFAISCGGLVSSSPPPDPPVTVLVSPSSAQPYAGASVPFSASVTNAANSAVNWQVNSIAGGNSTVGTIDANGVYTAPNSIPSPPTVTVTAVLQSDTTKTGSSSVTILSQSSIQGPLTLTPALSSVTLSQTLQLQLVTAGLSNSQVNWSVDGVPSGNVTSGTISGNGLYTPPPMAGSHLIIAALKANPAAIGTAQVEVTDFAGNLTWRNDNSRSGQNTRELALAPGTVNSSNFGKIFSCPLDGYAYAQPLYVPNLAIPGSGTHNVVIMATAMDSVFAFDADANPCVMLWQTGLVPAGEQAVPAPNLDITDPSISPFIGITGTPVIDPGSSTLYVVAETKSTTTNAFYTQRLYALDLATGQKKIQTAGVGLSTGSANPVFSSLLANQRAALLLDNGTVYIAIGSHNGEGSYHGWLLGYSGSTLQQTLIFDSTPQGMQGGIWQSGGGPSADSGHNVYVATGDGTFDANRGGMDYGDSFLRLTASGAFSVADYFSPCNQATLAATGTDLGASAPVLLPTSAGSATQPHLMIGAGKNGSLYVLNRDNLGLFNSSCQADSAPRAQVVAIGDGPILSTPLFWNNSIYLAAGNGALEAFPFSTGIVSSSPLASISPETLGAQGATPVVSSNGANNAIVWLIDSSGAQASPNTPAILRAFDANNLSNEIYNSTMLPSHDGAGLAVKFTLPTVANGKVYLGTQTELDVYGFLH